jgi:small-conductance mechanosensitive channel
MSIVAAAIAIITKEYIADFLVGLYFSFSRNFEINDYVRMGEFRGKITELQIFKVRLLNDDDDSVLIPNSKIYNTEITNYTRRDHGLMSVDFELGVSNISTIERLESDLTNSLQELMEFIEPDSFNLRIVEMRKDSVEMKFQYKLKQFDRELQRQIRKKTVRQVFNYIASKTVTTAVQKAEGQPTA